MFMLLLDNTRVVLVYDKIVVNNYQKFIK